MIGWRGHNGGDGRADNAVLKRGGDGRQTMRFLDAAVKTGWHGPCGGDG
jgi:hypothetical protein